MSRKDAHRLLDAQVSPGLGGSNRQGGGRLEYLLPTWVLAYGISMGCQNSSVGWSATLLISVPRVLSLNDPSIVLALSRVQYHEEESVFRRLSVTGVKPADLLGTGQSLMAYACDPTTGGHPPEIRVGRILKYFNIKEASQVQDDPIHSAPGRIPAIDVLASRTYLDARPSRKHVLPFPVDIAKLLVNAGCNPASREDVGSGLYALAHHSDPDSVELLEYIIKAGASADQAGSLDHVPLHFLRDCAQPEAKMGVLMAAGAGIEELDVDGATPFFSAVIFDQNLLHMVAAHGGAGVLGVAATLDLGCVSFELRDWDGGTPVDSLKWRMYMSDLPAFSSPISEEEVSQDKEQHKE
ncbi:hypothetical protein MKZ38_006021 [Zalerion maritima]|uniref:Uncharacterized protein n=1 Tax=Zalerion maritima TaxID=339359 RepID=A0AAD5RJZ0_9PEZI|nr:hypothetical protein MKZ38_006021 [Zalerion maritima]